ncbi:MAG: hypothetical protein IJB26_07100 [Clostridia bacterium]|nr:hypothetical protein [Clostridia bacterium]
MDSVFHPVDKQPAKFPYFPDPAFLVIWRNWGLVSPERIAKALDATVADVCAVAERMGLNPNPTVSDAWDRRGFLTIIRCNWNLCEYDQIMTLTNMTDAELEFTLREDDFMWSKMGHLKPTVERPRLVMPLTAAQEKRLDEIRAIVEANPIPTENAFEFLEKYKKAPTFTPEKPQQEHLRMLYSYFAVYGDTLKNDGADSFPDTLLAEYAACGINGIWFQGLLSQLAPNPWTEDTDAEGRRARLTALSNLIKRAAKYGIGVYLYFNEPRPMPGAFFEQHPELKGIRQGSFTCLCPSVPQVIQYLEDAMAYVFENAPGLAGYFSITYSENFTNCASRGKHIQDMCPRCKGRDVTDIMADMNNALARGAKRSNPNAKPMIYTWSWGARLGNVLAAGADHWDVEAIKKLDKGQYIISVSEEHLEFNCGGTDVSVIDYTMSKIGPSETSVRRFETAKQCGIVPAAKIQINNSWELSSMPYVPIFGLIGEHVSNLREIGIRDMMLTWTLGGSPSPITTYACDLLDGDQPYEEALKEFLNKEFGEAANVVYRAQQQFCEAFREYPFHVDVAYFGPHTYGPIAPFFAEPTGCTASMVGFPYDHLERWRGPYSEDSFENQYRLMCEGWKKGLDMLEDTAKYDEKYAEFCCMARASYCHLASAYNHIRFVRARDAKDNAKLLEIIANERELVKETLALRAQDSRIGFEASNHYYFVMQDLVEKLVNLDYLENLYK